MTVMRTQTVIKVHVHVQTPCTINYHQQLYLPSLQVLLSFSLSLEFALFTVFLFVRSLSFNLPFARFIFHSFVFPCISTKSSVVSDWVRGEEKNKTIKKCSGIFNQIRLKPFLSSVFLFFRLVM